MNRFFRLKWMQLKEWFRELLRTKDGRTNLAVTTIVLIVLSPLWIFIIWVAIKLWFISLALLLVIGVIWFVGWLIKRWIDNAENY